MSHGRGRFHVRRDQPRLLVEVEERIQQITDVTGLLESWGYRGWVRPSRQWVPVAAFPLAAHQASTSRVSERGLLARRGGGIRSEFTITKIADQKYYVVSAGAAERYDSDYLRKALPADGSVGLRNITTSRGCFAARRKTSEAE